MKFLQLNALPRSVDGGLLVLRLWAGLTMALNHGWAKLSGFGKMAGGFADPLGVGSQVSLSLAIFGELICGLLIAFGLFTRFAAIGCGITMAVAFFMVHQRALSGPASGELAFIYLGAMVTLLLTGAGRFSADAKMGAKV